MSKLGYSIFFLLSFAYSIGVKSQSFTPVRYWSFNKNGQIKDTIKGVSLDTVSYKCRLSFTKGIMGEAINLGNSNCLIVTNVMKENISDEFSMEFFFKGSSFNFLSFPTQSLFIKFDYSKIQFRTSIITTGVNTVSDDFIIDLKGSGRKAYDYYTDNNWHHFVFSASLKTGKKEIFVDGECPKGFSKTIINGKAFSFGNNDGFRNTDQIDELCFYNKILNPVLIEQHYSEVNSGKPYTFSTNSSKQNLSNRPISTIEEFDLFEFAPGYPNYTIQATEQLKSFPLPRYSENKNLPRNFPWMDINYLHRELPGKGGLGFGKVNPKTAVELTDELARNWNYYVEIPTLRADSISAQSRYRNQSGIISSLIRYANDHPKIPVATVLMQVQNKPADAGFQSDLPFVRNQSLDPIYYLKDKNGKPIIYDNKKWLNPFESNPLLKKEGLTSAFYLNQLARYLKRPVNIINENGEWFGHQWKEELLRQSPQVTRFLEKTGMNYYRFNGWMQNRFDSIYKTTILNHIPWQNVQFTFYNVSAYNSNYWPDYEERIMTNGLFTGSPRSTPAFYPARPDNWRLASGSLNGYGRIAEGRKKEFKLGVRYFAPFISAGWNLEEKNIRPGQWLGLLKSMVMLGADFFHVGYFNVTGSTGWPNGKGPNDPRGYIYQAAMPAYAQATASRIWDFLEKGELLEDSPATEPDMPFAFKASAPHHLVLVRKWNNRYLIYGSIQPNSNYKGNSVIEARTSIMLDGRKITFNIRRQGSMYVLDLLEKDPVFYQLDGWHQYEHPWYWSKSVEIEAENLEGLSGLKKITEKQSSSTYDFSTFNTYVLIDTDEISAIHLPSRRDGNALLLSLTLKKESGSPVLGLKTTSGEIRKEISSTDLFELKLTKPELEILQLKAEDELRLSVEKGSILLDKLVF